MGDWSRRRFLGTAADSALAVSLFASVTGALRPLAALADEAAATLTFYDPRFDAALALARAMPGAAGLRPLGADPTDLLLQLATASPRAEGLRLQGVTTGSVPFCLAQLFRSARLVERRVDRDLFAWTLLPGTPEARS